MTYQFEHSQEHLDARHLGTIVFADSGPGNSRIQVFATEYGDTGESPLVEIVLSKPCGSVVDHAIVLAPHDPTGDLIVIRGDAVWARWVNGNGVEVTRGTVTDETGDGPFKLEGAEGTLLRVGGRCRLGTTSLS